MAGNKRTSQAVGAGHPVRAVYVVMRLARELLKVPVPLDWLASLQPAGFDEHYLELARRDIFIPPVKAEVDSSSQVFTLLWGLKGIGLKLALIRDRLLPSRESMAAMYPVPANSWRIYLYYPVRWKEALVNNGAMLWRLMRGDPKTTAAVERFNQSIPQRNWLRLD